MKFTVCLLFVLKFRVGVIIVILVNEFGIIIVIYFWDCEYLGLIKQ